MSGDVDGIFGGSAETYVRDLQVCMVCVVGCVLCVACCMLCVVWCTVCCMVDTNTKRPTLYVRDLQFKSLMTTAMVMSGWASNPDKQVRGVYRECI